MIITPINGICTVTKDEFIQGSQCQYFRYTHKKVIEAQNSSSLYKIINQLNFKILFLKSSSFSCSCFLKNLKSSFGKGKYHIKTLIYSI